MRSARTIMGLGSTARRPAPLQFRLLKVAVLCAAIVLGSNWFAALARAQDAPNPQREKLANMEKTLSSDPGQRFYQLGALAKAAYRAGAYDEAANRADELLQLAPQFRDNWNYGNAIYDGNLVNGLVVLKRDVNFSLADGYLLAAGGTPGSPQLASFGPDMSLAQALLAAGQQDVVIDFLQRCQKFWVGGQDQLNTWIGDIQNGSTPRFRPIR
jgi:tetratricopeptide (TPR) repeat protein